jgi:hypothetical protein
MLFIRRHVAGFSGHVGCVRALSIELCTCVLLVNVLKLHCFVCVEMIKEKYYSSLCVTCE